MVAGEGEGEGVSPLSQPDGFADDVHGAQLVALRVLRGGQDDPYQTALDELTRALIKASAVRLHLSPPAPDGLLASSVSRFRFLAAVAVALADGGALTAAKAEAAEECGEGDPDDVNLARGAIDAFEAALYRAGETVTR